MINTFWRQAFAMLELHRPRLLIINVINLIFRSSIRGQPGDYNVTLHNEIDQSLIIEGSVVVEVTTARAVMDLSLIVHFL